MGRRGLIFLLLCFSGCGGGGGGSPPPPPPPPANSAPSFTSATSATTVENATGTIYQATATDANGDAITYSIAGGADAGRFSITAAGALSFTSPPNFDAFADADRNNIYLVQLRASDGPSAATLDLQVTVTNDREGVRVRRVATGLDRPVHVAAIFGSYDVHVLERGGRIYRVNPTTGLRTLVHTVPDLLTSGEGGLLAMVNADDFVGGEWGGDLFLVTGSSGNLELRQGRIGLAGYTVRLSIPLPNGNTRIGGWMGFDAGGGNLYVTTGDNGTPENAQNPFSLLGKVLQIRWCGIATPSRICGTGDGVARNPFVVAMGLRNPTRASLRTLLYIGDGGPSGVQEINALTVPGARDSNLGWPFLEGTQVASGTPPAGFVHSSPATQFLADALGRVIAGHVHPAAGNGLATLYNAYVFGDSNGNIWTVPASSLVQGMQLPTTAYERRNLDFQPDVGTIDQLVAFGADQGGFLYLIDQDGDIFYVDPSL